ncbi:CAMK family protein kinase, partial [Reticulomyxa filosa]
MLSLRWFSHNNASSAPTTPTVGGNAGRYQWNKKLADTLQGEIWLGKNTTTNKYVIIKVAIKQCVKNGVSKANNKVPEDFKNESRIHRMLTDHLKNDIRNEKVGPNEIGFVTCEHYFKDKTNYYLVMQYCKDGDLFDYISSHHKSAASKVQASSQEWIEQVRHLFRQMVKGVSYMHSYNIVHQDLSLENTMLFDLDSLCIKIIDFGVAKE